MMINNKYFEMETKKDGNLKKAFFELMTSKYRDYCTTHNYSLHDVYEKPSLTKLEIMQEWQKYFVETCDIIPVLKVLSYNTMMFTLGCEFGYNGKYYFAYITPTHNYIIPLDIERP